MKIATLIISILQCLVDICTVEEQQVLIRLNILQVLPCYGMITPAKIALVQLNKHNLLPFQLKKFTILTNNTVLQFAGAMSRCISEGLDIFQEEINGIKTTLSVSMALNFFLCAPKLLKT